MEHTFKIEKELKITTENIFWRGDLRMMKVFVLINEQDTDL